jgi:hypothetical protein
MTRSLCNNFYLTGSNCCQHSTLYLKFDTRVPPSCKAFLCLHSLSSASILQYTVFIWCYSMQYWHCSTSRTNVIQKELRFIWIWKLLKRGSILSPAQTASFLVTWKFPWQLNLLSRVYGQQVFLDKLTFSYVRSTSFPWQVSLDTFCSWCVHGMFS